MVERFLFKLVIFKFNLEIIRMRLDIFFIWWDILCVDIVMCMCGVEFKFRCVLEFFIDLEEFSLWVFGIIKLLEKGESVEVVDINFKVCCVVMIIVKVKFFDLRRFILLFKFGVFNF